jgi:hypothetical protein
LDAAIAAVAEGQHAVVGLRQLETLGLAERTIQQRATAGRLFRRYRGVYSIVPPRLLSREGQWMAAVLASGPGAVLSHRSAAALHALRLHNGTKIDVTIPGRVHRVQPGITIHRSTTLTDADLTEVDGIPVHDRRAHPVRPRRHHRPPRARARIRPVRDPRGVRPDRDAGPARAQHRPQKSMRARQARPQRALHRQHPDPQLFEQRLLPITRSLDIPDPDVKDYGNVLLRE